MTAGTTLFDLQRIMNKRGVNGFPVVDGEGRLVGMVTSRDIWIIQESAKTVGDVMTPREKTGVCADGHESERGPAVVV